MGIFDGFPFKSKDQVERERKEFADKILPLGEAQKQKALAVLCQITGPKLRSEEKLFAFFTAKQQYLDAGGGTEGVRAAQKKLAGFRYVPKEDAQHIVAMVTLEKDVESLDDYPTAEQVLAVTLP